MVPTPTLDTAHRVVQQVFDEEPLEPVAFLGEGTLNVVFVAHLPEGSFAIRLSKGQTDDNAYWQEMELRQAAALCDVPLPRVRSIGLSEGQPFLIETLAPGISGDTPDSDTLPYWRHLGQHARRLHDINRLPTRARLSEIGKQQFDITARAEWQRFVAYNLASLTLDDPLLALGVYTPSQRPTLQTVFERLQAIPFRFGLNHNDLDPRHLFLTPDGHATLIDWGCAEINLVPHYDLAEILRWHPPDTPAFHAFRNGYGLTDADFATILPQVRDYQLLKSIDLVRWTLDRCPEKTETYANRARETFAQWLRDNRKG